MKYFTWFLFALLLVTGCTKDRLPVRFQMAYLNKTIEIPAGLNVFQTHYFTIHNINSQIDAYLDANNISREEIDNILPSSCTLTNISSNGSYNFIDEVLVRIYDPSDPEVKFEIFYNDIVDLNAGSNLILFPNENNVKDFLTSDDFSLEIVLRRLRDSPTEFITTRVDLRFDVR
jgi:hypothetical protein